jgi:hypothetical protein
LAAVTKLLPALFLPWLLLKRQRSAAAALVVTSVVVAVLPCLAVFGPQRTLEYHREWWAYNVAGDAARGMMNPALREHFVDHRNQSIAQVLARLTWPEHPAYGEMPWHVAQLSEHACRGAAYVIAAILLAATMWVTRRPWRSLTTDQQHAEAAVYAIAMLVLSPLLRTYYLVWALPALVLLAQRAVGRDRDDAGRGGAAAQTAGTPRLRSGQAEPGRYVGIVGLSVWAAGMVAWIWPLPRLLGVHLVMLIVMGVLLVLIARGGRSRQPVDGGG